MNVFRLSSYWYFTRVVTVFSLGGVVINLVFAVFKFKALVQCLDSKFSRSMCAHFPPVTEDKNIVMRAH